MKNKKIINYLYCLGISLLFLFVVSRCSPYYIFNDWNDSNVYFTIGKSVLKGIVMYKDIFDQKGPILYFMHTLAYLISNNTFHGVFVLEVISFSFFLYFMNKIVSLYYKKDHIYWVVPLISMIVLASAGFYRGDSAEEFCLPYLAYGLYSLFKYYKNTYPNKMDKKEIIINGIVFGIVFWIKYTLIFFWIFYGISLLIPRIKKKEFIDGLKLILYFLLGFVIVSVPIFIYFIANNALYDLFYVYFYVNITAYTSNKTIIDRIIYSLYAPSYYLFKNPLLLISGCGLIYVLWSKKIFDTKYKKIIFTIIAVLSVQFMYFGSYYFYYILYAMPFCIVGILALTPLMNKLSNKEIKYISIIFIITCFAFTYFFNSNHSYHKATKSDIMQYAIANYMTDDDKSFLNYGILDSGINTVLNTTPTVKYYMHCNIEYQKYPIMLDEQRRYIKEKLVNYVLIKVMSSGSAYGIPYLTTNYEAIAKFMVTEDNKPFTYMLYKRKSEWTIAKNATVHFLCWL